MRYTSYDVIHETQLYATNDGHAHFSPIGIFSSDSSSFKSVQIFSEKVCEQIWADNSTIVKDTAENNKWQLNNNT